MWVQVWLDLEAAMKGFVVRVKRQGIAKEFVTVKLVTVVILASVGTVEERTALSVRVESGVAWWPRGQWEVHTSC